MIYIMKRLTKRCNNHTGTFENIDAFSDAGILYTIIKGIRSKFVKDAVKTFRNKALKAGINKVGSHVGNIAADKIISTVSKKFSKPPKEVVKTIVL